MGFSCTKYMSSYIQMMANSTKEATQARRAAEGSHCLDPRMFACLYWPYVPASRRPSVKIVTLGVPWRRGSPLPSLHESQYLQPRKNSNPSNCLSFIFYFALSDSQAPPILEGRGPQAPQKLLGCLCTHRSLQQPKQRESTVC